ncbi:hypothetical protein PLEOSDRAFT_1106044 [Pleurotus ostreatus PC15]|uniref:Uncharacterized protein n=1 Tax=Pleurotus ostreatus (strain PC15) TaxID=1137138 RepID=A0A067NU67_PLEO1|nr:hypothetical protein PLEOSDRAFT_1106044 [Pleurotus ostreatus PC15]
MPLISSRFPAASKSQSRTNKWHRANKLHPASPEESSLDTTRADFTVFTNNFTNDNNRPLSSDLAGLRKKVKANLSIFVAPALRNPHFQYPRFNYLHTWYRGPHEHAAVLPSPSHLARGHW